MNKQNDEFKLEPTRLDEGYVRKDFEQLDPVDEYEYFEVEVEKRMVSSVYIVVPKSKNFMSLSRREKDQIIHNAMDDTLSDGDWEEEDSDYNSPKPVTKKVAAIYDSYVVE